MHASFDRRGHLLMHELRVVAFDQVRRPSISLKEILEFLRGDTGQERGIGYLVSVQMQDRQHRAIVHRVEKFVGVPTRGKCARLGLAISHHAGDNQVRIIERSAISVH